jgi:uncharacterized protein YneF (UPF0154 family)
MIYIKALIVILAIMFLMVGFFISSLYKEK